VLHALTSAQGGEIYVRKAPACTVMDLARAMRKKYSPMGEDHPIEIVGIRPGEKIHEVLVNEYEVENSTEDDTFITIHPGYRLPDGLMVRPPGYEYTSDNTERVTDFDRLSALLDAAGDDDVYI
jgi:FlaA1/EpsC-like NDP-sugar epimerase